MKIPTIGNVPTPSTLLSKVHTLYDDFFTTITRMAASFDREDELWPQFEVSVQAVTDALKMYVELDTLSSSGTHDASGLKGRGECHRPNHKIRRNRVQKISDNLCPSCPPTPGARLTCFPQTFVSVFLILVSLPFLSFLCV